MPSTTLNNDSGENWSYTKSNCRLWHAFKLNEEGIPVALCRKDLRPAKHSNGERCFSTADQADKLPKVRRCESCTTKLAALTAQTAQAVDVTRPEVASTPATASSQWTKADQVRARKFAAKWRADQIAEEPTDDALTRAFARCVKPPKATLYPLIREELAHCDEEAQSPKASAAKTAGHGYVWEDLVEIPMSGLEEGVTFVQPGVGVTYRVLKDGTVRGAGIAWEMPIDGTAWTVTARRGDTLTARSHDGRTATEEISPTAHVLRVVPEESEESGRARTATP